MKMNNGRPLVSIITPCFNGETFIDRYFESVLSQTYPNLELIFINDGSTDRTEEIALSYSGKLKDKGIEFHYIYQDNAGQAAAVNKGLKIFKGEYLTWPDSDDMMTPDCIEKKVDFLEMHEEYGIVLCKTDMYKENDLNTVFGVLKRKDIHNHNIFSDLIFGKDIYFAPGGYMVRTDAFLKSNPKREIYESNVGQNWQMLLPIAYTEKCGFMDEVLYKYVIRAGSHSRLEKDFSSIIEKTFRHEDTLFKVIDGIEPMPEEEKGEWKKHIGNHYLMKRFYISCECKAKDSIEDYYKILKDNNLLDKKAKIRYIRAKNVPVDWFFKSIEFFVSILRKAKRKIFK